VEKTLTVRFDGQVFHPQTPVDLAPDTEYEITIRPKADSDSGQTMWELLGELAGTVEAPEDWSLEHDHYIRGCPKRWEKPEE
jgi:hypothetical protein